MDNADAVASKNNTQAFNISGNIGVTAGGGAKIESADINLNGGANMAFAGGGGF